MAELVGKGFSTRVSLKFRLRYIQETNKKNKSALEDTSSH